MRKAALGFWGIVAAVFLAWAGAWAVKLSIWPHAGPWSAFAYWTAAKLALWIALPLALIRWRDGAWAGGLRRGGLGLEALSWRPMLMGLALLAVLLAILTGAVLAGGGTAGTLELDGPALLNAILMAPILEEILFRGILWRDLERRGHGPIACVLITAVLFALLHVVGWTAMGLPGPSIAVDFVVIAALGAGFGLVRWRLGLIGGAIPAHMANNIAATGALGALLTT